jgi:hypothetical protein
VWYLIWRAYEMHLDLPLNPGVTLVLPFPPRLGGRKGRGEEEACDNARQRRRNDVFSR